MRALLFGLVFVVLASACVGGSSEEGANESSNASEASEPSVATTLSDADRQALELAGELCRSSADVSAYAGEVTAMLGREETRFCLGPALAQGGLESAQASIGSNGQDGTVNPTFTETGIDAFNLAAAECFERTAICPTGKLAIVINGRVASAPSIQTPFFNRDQIQIVGLFTFREAQAFSNSLNRNPDAISFHPVVAEVSE